MKGDRAFVGLVLWYSDVANCIDDKHVQFRSQSNLYS